MHGVADQARMAGESGETSHLSVRRDATARDAQDDIVDAAMQTGGHPFSRLDA
jgi:hypothetical protein